MQRDPATIAEHANSMLKQEKSQSLRQGTKILQSTLADGTPDIFVVYSAPLSLRAKTGDQRTLRDGAAARCTAVTGSTFEIAPNFGYGVTRLSCDNYCQGVREAIAVNSLFFVHQMGIQP